MLAMKAAMDRTFTTEEDAASGAHNVALLGDGL